MSDLMPTPYLMQVMPDDTEALNQIMFHGDYVRPIPDFETLLRNRVGDGSAMSSRRTFSIATDVDGKRIIGATIFVDFSTADINRPSGELLYGNIREMDTTPAQSLVEEANLLTCYSVSSYKLSEAYARLMPSAGKLLIKALYEKFNDANRVISTCSPVRSVQAFLARLGLDHIDDPEQLQLLTAAHIGTKPPQTAVEYHTKNGGYSGKIHVVPNAAGGLDNVNGYDVMVGMRYPRTPAKFSANQMAWKTAGEFPASSSVRELLERSTELMQTVAPAHNG